MISYPGDILARFGRYEAVEDLGRSERAHLWRAWDPFLERFVIVASLPGVTPAELYREVPSLERALGRWVGAQYGAGTRVLDFGPGQQDESAFFVLEAPGETQPEAPAPRAVPAPVAREVRRGPAPAVALVAGGLIASVLTWLALRAFAPPPGTPDAGGGVPTAAAPAAEVAAVPGAPHATSLEMEKGRRGAGIAPADTGAERWVAQEAGGGTEAPLLPQATAAAAMPEAAPEEVPPNTPRQPPQLSRLEPPPGTVRIATGEAVEFVAEARDPHGLSYAWFLDRKKVSTKMRYRFHSDFLAEGATHAVEVTVVDPGTGRSTGERWVLIVDPGNSEPQAAITRAASAVSAGGVLEIEADVEDRDVPRGDKLDCVWAIDGVAKGHYCRRFEWQVPADAPPGQVTASLTVRDARGASVRRDAAVAVRGPAATARVAVRPAPPTAGSLPRPAAAAPKTQLTGGGEETKPAAPRAAGATSAGDDDAAIRAAVRDYARSYEARLHAKGIAGAVVTLNVIDITHAGVRAEARVTRTVEVPSQNAQRAERTLRLEKRGGVWTVAD